MTLKEFILKNEVTSVQYAEGVVFSVLCNEVPYGIDADTSSIEAGTKLIETTEFIINETELIVEGMALDLDNTNILI
jgi:hypothetical protein